MILSARNSNDRGSVSPSVGFLHRTPLLLSPDPNLLVDHAQRKADEHKSEGACGQMVDFATPVERPTYRTCAPRSADIHHHHDDREDHPQQRDLERHLFGWRCGELRKEQAEEEERLRVEQIIDHASPGPAIWRLPVDRSLRGGDSLARMDCPSQQTDSNP